MYIQGALKEAQQAADKQHSKVRELTRDLESRTEDAAALTVSFQDVQSQLKAQTDQLLQVRYLLCWIISRADLHCLP